MKNITNLTVAAFLAAFIIGAQNAQADNFLSICACGESYEAGGREQAKIGPANIQIGGPNHRICEIHQMIQPLGLHPTAVPLRYNNGIIPNSPMPQEDPIQLPHVMPKVDPSSLPQIICFPKRQQMQEG